MIVPAGVLAVLMMLVAAGGCVDTSRSSTGRCRPTSSEVHRPRRWLSRPSRTCRLIGILMEHCAANIPGVQAAVGLGLPHPECWLGDGRAGVRFTLVATASRVAIELSRVLDVDVFAPGLSFFFLIAHVDFFEGDRRSSARPGASGALDARRHGAQSGGALACGSTPQTAGVSPTAQQPSTTWSALASRRSSAVARRHRTPRLTPTRLTRRRCLPSEQAAEEIALRTQQVIMEGDRRRQRRRPAGGSWYVEALTRPHRGRGERDLRQDPGHGRLGRSPPISPRSSPRRSGRRRTGWSRAGCLRGSRRAGSCPRSPRRPSSTRSPWRSVERSRWRRRQLPRGVGHPRPEILRVSARGRGRAGPHALRPAGRGATPRQSGLPSTGWPAPRPGPTENMIEPMLDACRAEGDAGRDLCTTPAAPRWGEYPRARRGSGHRRGRACEAADPEPGRGNRDRRRR